MNKPIRLWTNEENMEYCKRRRDQPIVCSQGCELYRAGICRVSSPYNWKIGPSFTPEEIQDAKTIAKLFPGAVVRLRKKENGEFCIYFHATVQIPGEDIAPMELRFGKVDIFPNLKPGESVTLDEVIGGGE